MARLRRFLIYFLIFLAFYFLSNIAIIHILKSTYKDRLSGATTDSPYIEIEEFQTTLTNGYIKGKVTNNTGEDMIDKVVKVDLISPRGVVVGTKYVDVGTIRAGETKDFETHFNYDNVTSSKVSLIDKSEVPDKSNAKLFEWDNLKFDKLNLPWYAWVFGFLYVLSETPYVLLM